MSLRIGLFHRFILLTSLASWPGLAQTPSIARVGDAVAVDASNIFVLEPFEVNEVRPWTYVRIDGYEILSVIDEVDTRIVAQRMQADQRFAPLFIPDELRINQTIPNVLVLQPLDDREVIAKFRTRVRPGQPIDFALFDQGDCFHAFVSGATTDVVVKGRRSGANSPLAAHLISTFTLVRPEPPAWYLEGLKYLLRNGNVVGDSLTLHGPQRIAPGPVPIEAILKTTPAELDRMRLQAKEERDRFEWLSALFIHWGFFSDGGIRRETFLRFVGLASRQSLSDEVLKRSFGIGFDDLSWTLRTYKNVWWRSRRTIDLPDAMKTADESAIEVRPASQAEVARILSESYIALARGDVGIPPDRRYLGKARELLTEALGAWGQTNGIKVAFGLLYVAEGRSADAAGTFEELALTDPDLRPRANYEMARLRYRAALRETRPEGLLDAETTRHILSSLNRVLQADPKMEMAFQLAVALWSHSAVGPSSGDLALLERGARAFPGNSELIALLTALPTEEPPPGRNPESEESDDPTSGDRF
ncbi:MAG: hypothetical protein R3F07_00540 [Opitutaceae bacterium]